MNKKEDYYTFNEYMKNNNLTPSEEDYIEMIYRLSLEKENVKVKDISHELNIKPPSVTKMIKKLGEKNMLKYRKYDSIELTELGISAGNRLLKRHNIVKEFLTIIGVKESLHEETEKIEHTINVETLVRIEELIYFINVNQDIKQRFIDYKNKNN